MHETLLSALVFSIGIGFCSLIVTGALIPVLPGFFHLNPSARLIFTRLVILLSMNLAVAFPTRMLGAYLCSLERFDLYNAAAIGVTVGRAVLITWMLHLGQGVCSVAAVMLVTTAFSMTVHWRLVLHVDPELAFKWKYIRWFRIEELFRYGAFAFINSIGNQLRLYTDSLVIARMLGAVFITQFNIATKLVGYFTQVMSGVSGPVMGRMSELDGQTKERELQQYFLRTTRITALVAMLIGFIIVGNGRLIIILWVGKQFGHAYSIVFLLGACFTVSLSLQSNWIVIMARAKHQPMALWNIIEGLANFALSVYWAKAYGLIGVALGTVIPMLVSDLFVWPWYALKIIRLPVREYISKGLARPLCVGALFALVCWYGRPSQNDSAYLSLASTVLWESVVFSALAYAIALESSERQMLCEQAKRLVVGLKVVRAS
jgi:O-antigen/teichoic acid export membrane protein